MDDLVDDLSEPIIKKRKLADIEEFPVLEGSDAAYDEPVEITEDTKAPHILNSFKRTSKFPTVTERYLTPYYFVAEDSPGEDTCIWVHSNRICLISLAPSHRIIKERKTIKSINFKVSEKLDRASNKVSGKSKHGAQPLQPSSTICSIECDDGDEVYSVKCNMTGKLMEVNHTLVKNPELLFQPPHTGGYLAIALPNIAKFETLTTELLTQELYEAKIAERESKR